MKGSLCVLFKRPLPEGPEVLERSRDESKACQTIKSFRNSLNPECLAAPGLPAGYRRTVQLVLLSVHHIDQCGVRANQLHFDSSKWLQNSRLPQVQRITVGSAHSAPRSAWVALQLQVSILGYGESREWEKKKSIAVLWHPGLKSSD